MIVSRAIEMIEDIGKVVDVSTEDQPGDSELGGVTNVGWPVVDE